MGRNFKYILFVVSGIGLIGLLVWRFPDALRGRDNWMQLISLGAVLTYLATALFSRKINLSETVKYIGVWIGIGLTILLGYSYRHDFSQVAVKLHAALFPFQGTENPDGSISFPVGYNGHFIVEAQISGKKIRFVVDTGASNVVLTKADAERIGIITAGLRYNQLYNTANGQTWSAPINLRRIQIGPIVIKNVQASVSKGGLNESLLGMSFLEKLKGYEVRNDVLTLRN